MQLEKSLPHLSRNKISSYPTGGMLEKILPHPNLFCCNVKVPDIKYVMKQFSFGHQGPKLPFMSKIICC
jgi:hypothetical protein